MDILAESFILSFQKANSTIEKKEVIYEYLRNHYNKDNHLKVADFPLNSEWINTTQPLSIDQDLKNKLVLLDFFTYCCINCMHVLPDLKALENKYSIQDGLVVVGVHCAKFTNEKESKNIASAVKRHNVRHAVVNDSAGIVWQSFNTNCWPTIVVIGPNSQLLLSLQGEGHFEILDCFIETTLAFMNEKKLISNNPLPQIRVTNELQSFNVLSFPGKITSYNFNGNRLLAVSDTGNHRIIVLNETGAIKNIVGGNEPGFSDGAFDCARFNLPQGLVFKNQHILYVADTENHAIREVNLNEKVVKTVAGTGKQGHDRIGGKCWIQQEISSPWDVCFGENTNVLLIAMAGTHQIWGLYLSNEEHLFKKGRVGECKAIAGSGREENRNNYYPQAAAFAQPSGLTYCPERKSIFIADSESSTVRELNLEIGKVSAVVGGNRNPLDLFAFGDKDGTGLEVKLQHPLGVTWDEDNRKLYVADSYNHKIKVINLSDYSCSSIKLDLLLNEPGGLCIFENQLVIADTNNHCLKLYNLNNSKMDVLSIVQSIDKNIEQTNDEKNVKISKNGGKLHIKIKLNKPESISLTEDAPAFWNIRFVDAGPDLLVPVEFFQKLRLETDLTVDVPRFVQKSNLKLALNGSAYFCKGDLCFLSDINLLINIYYTDGADEILSCDFIHNLQCSDL